MRTLRECVKRCAAGAYHNYMGGYMGSKWSGINTETYAWVFGVPHEEFLQLCEKEYRTLFKETKV